MGNDSIRRHRKLIARVATLAWIAVAVLAAPVRAQDVCADDTVHLRGDWGMMRFSVEVARTRAEQNQGLMHRTEMPISSGMLFVYTKPQKLSFWMRNTLIPLDMLFIDAAGVVQHIHENAVPLDETPISGGDDPQLAVLEINGGLSSRLGITEGTQIRHPAFDIQTAAWPCSD